MKWDILKNAKKLKEVKTGDLKDIFIVPDKTFQEREEYYLTLCGTITWLRLFFTYILPAAELKIQIMK